MIELKIKSCDNGYILESEDSILVFQINENIESKKHIVEMLYSILENLGEYGSKHDKERIRIDIENNYE